MIASRSTSAGAFGGIAEVDDLEAHGRDLLSYPLDFPGWYTYFICVIGFI